MKKGTLVKLSDEWIAEAGRYPTRQRLIDVQGTLFVVRGHDKERRGVWDCTSLASGETLPIWGGYLQAAEGTEQ